MKVIYLGALLGMSLLMSGCVVNVRDDGDDSKFPRWEQLEMQNRDSLARLALGMKKDEVLALMGRADFYEAWFDNGTEVQVFFYRTNRVNSDGSTTKDECTPVVLHNNQLIGWGETPYRKG